MICMSHVALVGLTAKQVTKDQSSALENDFRGSGRTLKEIKAKFHDVKQQAALNPIIIAIQQQLLRGDTASPLRDTVLQEQCRQN